MQSGVYSFDSLNPDTTTIRVCEHCHKDLRSEPKMYVAADILNPQLPPYFFHQHCAAMKRLDDVESEFIHFEFTTDLRGKLYHRRRPYDLFVIMRDHLMVRFELNETQAEHVIREWAEQF